MISAFGVQHEVAKSFMPTKGELGMARSITGMGPDVRHLLKDNLANTARLRGERGGVRGSLKKPSNAAERHPRAVDAARDRFRARRLKAWEAKGSPRVGAEKQPRKVRQAPVTPTVAAAKKPANLEAHSPVSGRTVASIAATTGVAAGAGYGAHRLRKSADDPNRPLRTGLGVVAGAAAADAVHDTAGQALKVRNAAVRRDKWDNKKHRAIWDEHRRSHGVSQVTGKTSEAVKGKLYRSYPKELPGWRGQRALAQISRPAVKAGVVGAAAAAGGALAYRHRVKKADDTKRHAEETAAATAGGGAGQGAYQGAGYKTKHHVDSRTRKGGVGVTSAQVNHQDKVLKPLKREHGMHLPNGHPDRNNVGYHRNYPTELPHGRTIRILGHTHEGRLGVATGAATTALGAASAFGVAHHLTKPKNPYEERS